GSRLPLQTESRPPWSRLVMEMPLIASSTTLLAMIEPSKANSAHSAVSPRRAQLLPMIWHAEPELLRMAERAQSRTVLPLTITPPARKMLMPLPYSPVPPASAEMWEMRLPETIVPSSPFSLRQTWMPLLPQWETVLPVIARPVASRQKRAEWLASEMVEPVMRPPQPVR